MRSFAVAVLALAAASCARGKTGVTADSGPTADSNIDASCGDMCDQDHDGVFDPMDQCPNTPAGAMVNRVGCSDAQAMWKLAPTFPPFGLGWTESGAPGRAGGLTWTYANIDHTGLFHIAWVVCDDPATPCGLSLDGAIDVPAENWQFDGTSSDLPHGKLVFSNTTHIALADGTMPQLEGRLTVTITDSAMMPIAFAMVSAFGLAPRSAQYGAETYPLVNRTPDAASASRFGVGMSLHPWNPTSA